LKNKTRKPRHEAAINNTVILLQKLSGVYSGRG